MSDLILKVTMVQGPADGEGSRMERMLVDVVQGEPTDDELLAAGLSLASAIITKRAGAVPLEDQLEDVWNRLADMVETCIPSDPESMN